MKKENEAVIASPGDHEMAQIDVCSTLRQISTDQDLPETKDTEPSQTLTELKGGKYRNAYDRRVDERCVRDMATTQNRNITTT